MEKKGFKNHILSNLGCMECGKKVRRFRIHKGRFLCYDCYRKSIHMMGSRINNRVGYTINEALNKVYEVKGNLSCKGTIIPYVSIPSILIGHKIKLVLVDNI